LLNTKRGHR